MPLLERLAALFGLLDRDARQRMVLALLRGENDRAVAADRGAVSVRLVQGNALQRQQRMFS